MVNVMAVDGDIVAYRISSVAETLEEAKQTIDDTYNSIALETNVSLFRTYFTGPNNFRKEVAVQKEYKGNRKNKSKPELFKDCVSYMCAKYNGIVVDGFEADDAIASDMTQNGAIHCGVDKDILQVAGTHYNYVKKKWVEVSEAQAAVNLYTQILVGDSSDNIPGLPKVGAVKAQKIIKSPETAEVDCKVAYMEVYDDEWPYYYNEQASLVSLVSCLDILDMITTQVKGRLF